MTWTVRPFVPTDEPTWLRCRVLGFLGTAYFDDVQPAKPAVDGPDLVAVAEDGTVAGMACQAIRPLAADIAEQRQVPAGHQHAEDRGGHQRRVLLLQARHRVPGERRLLGQWSVHRVDQPHQEPQPEARAP